MATVSWKQESTDDSATTNYVSLREARKFFAVDASGSTAGAICRAEVEFVQNLHSNTKDSVVQWGSFCADPYLLDMVEPESFVSDYGGTSPENILEHAPAVDEINCADIWYLLTDGEVSNSSVSRLTSAASRKDLTNVPVILLIVGKKAATPEQTNISVGISFFANSREAAILFKDVRTGQIYVIAAKGVFAPLKASDLPASSPLSDWYSLPVFANEAQFAQECEKLSIKVALYSDRKSLKALSLGDRWDSVMKCLVDIDVLLDQQQIDPGDLENLLQEEAMNELAVACKTRDRLRDLRALLVRHRQEQVTVRLEDRHGAARILELMQRKDMTSEETEQLQRRLRDAHAANRADYLRLINSPSVEVLRARELNALIDQGLAILATVEQSGYTADILSRKSNRARRAQMITATDATIHLSHIDLSDSANAYRGSCIICYGDGQIMSIALKELAMMEENTTDFALNCPLAAGLAKRNRDMVCSQLICFQCALLRELSIYNEKLSAVLPIVEYSSSSQAYINHQLTLAITTGLRVGVAPTVQMFMTILDKTLDAKAWCGEQPDVTNDRIDADITNPRLALNWMLQTLLRNCETRKTFSETGDWVKYPIALRWIITDFEEAGLDSFVIKYPVGGFNQLLRWYRLLELDLPASTLDALVKTKLIHLVVTQMLAELLEEPKGDKMWTSPYLRLIYREFNAPGIPRDLGPRTLVEADRFWERLTAVAGKWPDIELFWPWFTPSAQTEIARRIQLIIFWLVYVQKRHTTPKSFFREIRLADSLAPSVLDPRAPVPSFAVENILLSLFCRSRPPLDASHPTDISPPFATPFGPSVLRCGIPSCGVTFYDASDPASLRPDAVRARRAAHFRAIFGATPAFADSPTGLPTLTAAPAPPTSTHCNLHATIVRAWNALDTDHHTKTRILASDPVANAEFAAHVVERLCRNDGRGNIYNPGLEQDVQTVMPSFLQALRVAAGRQRKRRAKADPDGSIRMMEGRGDDDEDGDGDGNKAAAEYIIDPRERTVEARIRQELELEVELRSMVRKGSNGV